MDANSGFWLFVKLDDLLKFVHIVQTCFWLKATFFWIRLINKLKPPSTEPRWNPPGRCSSTTSRARWKRWRTLGRAPWRLDRSAIRCWRDGWRLLERKGEHFKHCFYYYTYFYDLKQISLNIISSILPLITFFLFFPMRQKLHAH